MFKVLFTGRVGRLGFLFGSLYYLLACFVPYIIIAFIYVCAYTAITHKAETKIPLAPMYALTIVLYVALILCSLSIAARRLNDVERPTWFCIFTLVPFVNVPMTVYLLLAPGTPEDNTYGAPSTSFGFWEVTLFRELKPQQSKHTTKKR
jgi:uncharacterized membrane protein YhaH (DUF805 family)